MAHDGDDDRRTAPRLRLRRKVTVSLRGAAHETHTINVSAGGASVELVNAPTNGSRGSIILALSEGAPLNLLAEVRWISALSTSGVGGDDTRYLVGLQFLSVPADAATRLAAALAAEEEDDLDDE